MVGILADSGCRSDLPGPLRTTRTTLMWTGKKRLLAWILFVAIGAPSVFLFVRHEIRGDPGTTASAEFLRQSERLAAVVGDIQSVRPTGKLVAGRTASEPAYTTYTFVVTGTRDERRVAVLDGNQCRGYRRRRLLSGGRSVRQPSSANAHCRHYHRYSLRHGPPPAPFIGNTHRRAFRAQQ